MNRPKVAALLAPVLVASGVGVAAAPARAADPVPSSSPPAAAASVRPELRDRTLPKDWRTSRDLAWTTRSDADGFHLLSATQSSGYAWHTVASLREPGVEADRWIGNACLTGSGRRAVVVYAPRTFVNDGDLLQRGGFTAVVDLATGQVTKLPVRASLAYFNPGCGAGERAVLTQSRGGEYPSGTDSATRLVPLDAATARPMPVVQVDQQVTSAVPVDGGGIAAASGNAVVAVDRSGLRTLARTTSVPMRLTADAGGGIVFLENDGTTGYVRRLARLTGTDPAPRIAHGPLTGMDVRAGTRGRVFVQGRTTGTLPGGVGLRRLTAPPAAQPSTEGDVAVLPAPETPAAGTAAGPALTAQLTATGATLAFTVPPAAPAAADPPAGTTVDADAWCAVARNDPRTQVYQPTPRQVEWAADQAVTGSLATFVRPANWKKSGLPGYAPQGGGMFPPEPLAGGGRVPAQVLLGILAQESNLSQASWHALPGVPGNPLIGNYYGVDIYDDDESDDWDIRWDHSDCGYGVSQITDGMRKPGHNRPGEIALTADQQRAVAVDYAVNVSAGLQVLQKKWNQTRAEGLIHDNGDPKWLENWYFAIWAYNSGLHPNRHDGTPWGVGWLNNPANPIYPANRAPFNRDPADAAHPERWPYQDKVIGFAAYSMSTPSGPGFRPAWWVSAAARDLAQPPSYQFCAPSIDCYRDGSFHPDKPDDPATPEDESTVGQPDGPCGHRDAQGRYDLQCWWHDPAMFHQCSIGQCGNELLRFDPGYAEQPDGGNYPPRCNLAGLPHDGAGVLVVDDVADSVPSLRDTGGKGEACNHPWTNAGSFAMTFGSDGAGHYPAKVDTHQIGGGFGGHFWFAHTWNPADATTPKMTVTGRWTFNRAVTGWARVLVHMPDHGAETQQARYEIDTGRGISTRYALQGTLDHRWVSLGVLQFAGTPKITLGNRTWDGSGSDDVAWDAVAVEPLAAKPRQFVVALGDSYTSGEGAAEPDAKAYYPETDSRGGNVCHRSVWAWPRRGTLADAPLATMGQRADSFDDTLDFQFHACSGARTWNVMADHSLTAGEPALRIGEGQYGEVPQIDKGYLDANTTLVMMSIGGNDTRFSDIIKECVLLAGPLPCMDTKLPGESEPVKVTVPRSIATTVHDGVMWALQQIHRRAPNAKIVLMGYPRLLPARPTTCVQGMAISQDEQQWLNDTGTTLTTMLSTLATGLRNSPDPVYVPVWFSDPRPQFYGKEVCGNPETINAVVINKTPGEPPSAPTSVQSFHPKIAGTLLYANSLIDTLTSLGM
jgi:hypothetical protein